jgi:hypothetical protein
VIQHEYLSFVCFKPLHSNKQWNCALWVPSEFYTSKESAICAETPFCSALAM